MPILSAILAITAIMSGVFVFITYKQNVRGGETADFDFASNNELLEVKTFWERIQDDVTNAWTNLRSRVLRHIQINAESESLIRSEPTQNSSLRYNTFADNNIVMT